MKDRFWSKDWFAALAFSLVFLGVTLAFSDSFQSLERYGYDLGVRARDRAPSERIAVIAIDDHSIANLGRWPWPRTLHAQMLDKLREGGAKVVGNTVFYSESQEDPGLAYIDEVQKWLAASPLMQQVPNDIQTFGMILEDEAKRSAAVAGLAGAWRDSALATQYVPAMQELATRLAGARGALAADDVLGKSMADFGRVLLPMSFEIGRPQGRPDAALPDYVRRHALANISGLAEASAAGALPLPTLSVEVPVAALGRVAAGIGNLTATPDIDGALRFEPLVLQHFDELYPSLSLITAAAALNLTAADVQVRMGEGVTLGGLSIDTTSALRMYTHFYSEQDGQPPFLTYSFYDVIAGKVAPAQFRDKVVLIGATARGVGDAFATPVSPSMAPVLVLAHAVSSILQEDFFTRPAWAMWLELALVGLILAWLAFALPRLKPTLAAGITAGGVVVLLLAQVGAMSGAAVWIKLMIPVAYLVAGHLFMTIKQFRLTEMLKASSEAEGAESNKMLGLAFQGQGQLDMAFDKFRRVQPVDDKVLDLIYNLALDFERKRQFNKAESAYQYIAGFDKDFRDIPQKLSRAKKLSETVILGGGGGSHPGGTLILDAGNADATQKIEKPMLGRYQVEKELGKGAMGIVYMGKDPKIGRTVAIKTMALTQEFEPDELAGVKERFFREAETAGRLTHPHIVAIYDAGEEHDLAYIAMEFIRGYDLTRHVKPAALLPTGETLRLVADAADALDYAHANGIVHRDIKPANMMLVEATRSIKLMDFGIARIADSSKTKTGMVLGTPSYMSPEQLSGKKVDGRSDLFSLGVTLYQLLTGALPFQADSMATLMFKIANEAHAPIGTVRPDLPPPLDPIIDRAMNKDVDQRYQRGSEFARDLRAVLAGLGGVAA